MTGHEAFTSGQEGVSLIDPSDFARMVGDASDDQLRQGFATNRELILGEIFRRMAEHLHAERARGVDAVVEWRILEGAQGRADRWQVTIRGGSCSVMRGGDQQPRLTFTLNPVDFVRLVTANASGPKLFLVGRLKVEGDLVLAARMPAMFTIPRA